MSWLKGLLSKKSKKQSSEELSCGEKTYTYSVSHVSAEKHLIYILCKEVDSKLEPETFTFFLKKFAKDVNAGVWEGNILPAGEDLTKAEYKIKNDRFELLFRYNGKFGIIIEYSPNLLLHTALLYLDTHDIEVDDFSLWIAERPMFSPSTQVEQAFQKNKIHTSASIDYTTSATELRSSGILVIPEGTKEIKRSEYEKQHNIQQVVLPEGLETIGDSAFYGCVNLEKINIPRSVKKMGQQVFFGCEKLTSAGPYTSNCSIEFDASNAIIENLFFNCKYLKRVHLPNGISCIGKAAFEFCESIKEISIPEGVTDIQADAFAFCKSLQKLSLPDSVSNIDTGAFRGCNQLSDLNGFIILRSVLYGCLNLNDTIVIPQGVTTIDSDAFVLGTSTSNDVTTTIVIPESVVRITHHRAFLRCKKLETVIIPENPSDEVKQVAQIIADRAEERRRQREKPKPVYIRTPEQLCAFHNANRTIMSDEVYKAILAKFKDMRDKVLGKGGKTDARWSESATMISLFDEDSHWVGHDDTVTDTVELKFERLSRWDEPEVWSSESEWPCEGQYQYLNESVNKGDSWSYLVMSRKGWLLRKPFGLPGVWSFEYMSKSDR